MIGVSVPSLSDHLSLEEVVAQLEQSSLVDGIAEFGSRATHQAGESSDYDLLVLVEDIPARVFQMVTSIGGRIADIVLVETEIADRIVTTLEPPEPKSFEALFAQKMQTAHIVYDASKRLQHVKQLVTSQAWEKRRAQMHDDSDLYGIWFWLGFGLLHLERLAHSQDPIQRAAFDMMLTSCLSATWRSYFDIRRLPWEGE
ncbi:MAG: nucleotidyltransferase domain-containing protein [Chloroflexota bacterium]|nr:nucleotidyltransferase domain-containing protein [Chloroflexota bacterium]